MSELTVPQLAAFNGKSYVNEVKARLRKDDEWIVLLDPVLVERTRATLSRIVSSIDDQKARIAESGEEPDAKWLRGVDLLRHCAKDRLDAMAPAATTMIASSKEVRRWRSFSARLATALGVADPAALDRLRTPYGDMTAREWLAAREEKRETAR